MFKLKALIWVLMFGFLFLVNGCERIDKESLNKMVQEDSLFKEQMFKKEELDSKISLLMSQLQQAKATAYANIRAIQENFNKQRIEIDSKIIVLKRELDPERLKIRQEIESLMSVISSKKAMLKDLENTRRNLNNLISQQKAVNVTSEDMAKWQERLATLDGQIAPIKGEARELEEKLHLLRMKLLALRQ